MRWQDFTARCQELLAAPDDHAAMAAGFADLATAVRAADFRPPHLARLVEVLDEHQAVRPGQPLAILDHGCGSGWTLFYLAARGHTDLWGVDIGQPRAANNRLLNIAIGAATGAAGDAPTRMLHYDGRRLPFEDARFDVAFSQQVLEHVAPECFAAYYAEEARVLTRPAVAYHQVPHRLTPYDSHTRTWFLHWLPKPMSLIGYRLLGRNVDFARENLHLRWPWVHRRWLARMLGPSRNLAVERLVDARVNAEQRGTSGRVRRIVAGAAALPGLGALVRAPLSAFIMAETLTRLEDPGAR